MIREWVYCRHGKWVPKGTKRPASCADCRHDYYVSLDIARGRYRGIPLTTCPHGVEYRVTATAPYNCRECTNASKRARRAREASGRLPKRIVAAQPPASEPTKSGTWLRCEDCGKTARETSRGTLCRKCWSDEDEARNRTAA